MATYSWRVGIGAFNQAMSWRNITTGQDVATTAPGTNDTALLDGAGQTVTGPAGTIDQLTIQAPPGAVPWEIAGTPAALTAKQLIASTGLNLTFGAALTLTGRTANGALPSSAILNGPVTVNASQLSATGTLAIGTTGTTGALAIVQGGRVTALAATVGAGAAGILSVQNSTLALKANPALEPPGIPSGTLTLGAGGGSGQLYLGTGGAITTDAALILGADAGSTGSADLSGAATLTTAALTIGAGSLVAADDGTVIRTQGRITVGSTGPASLTLKAKALATTTADVLVNGAGSAASTLTVNAATLRASALRIADTGPATAQVTGAASQLDISTGAIQLGASASGTLQIQAGGSVLANTLTVGANAAGTGTLLIDGTGSTLGVTGAGLVLGVAGGAATTVTAGATLAASTLATGARSTLRLDGAGTLASIGSTAALLGATSLTAGARLTARTTDSRTQPALSLARTGPATLSLSASTLDAQGYAYIGRAGAGTLTLDQGSQLTAGSAAAADGLGANAPFGLTIGDGTPAADANGNPVPPEYGGSGTARILNGSTLRSRAGIVVGQRGTNGTLLVDGASLVAADRLIQIGAGADRAGATGSVTVQGNSTLRSAGPHLPGVSAIQIGVDANTAGQLTIINSTLDAGGDRIAVGLRGAGTLTLQAGATASAGGALPEPGLTIASTAGSNGVVTVTGANTRLLIAGSAIVGGSTDAQGGAANLIATQGGSITARAITVWSQADLRTDGAAQINVGDVTAPTAGINIAAAATLTLQGGEIDGPVTIAGTLLSYGGLLTGAVTAPGQLRLAAGTTDVAAIAGRIAFTAPGETLRLRSLTGATVIDGLQPGDIIETTQPATLSGNKLTIGAVSATLAARPGDTLRLDALPTGTRLTITDPLFDAAYYLSHNPDIKAAGVDPYLHYITAGYKEGRDPSALFSTSFYLRTNSDIAAAGINPLLHFETTGWKEGRNPDAVFNVQYYLAQNPDVAALGLDPLLHYVLSGAREGRNPSAQFSLSNYRAAYPDTGSQDPLAQYLDTGRAAGRTALAVGPTPEPGFDSVYYYAKNPDVRAAGADAGQHYATAGFKEGRNPDAYFDTNYYLTQNPDIRAAGIDPLAHYIASGAAEGRNPSLLFSTTGYLRANPDVGAARLNPLLHFLAAGRAEGRTAPLSGPSAPADPLIQAAFYDRQLGATLIPTGPAAEAQAAGDYLATGWTRGLNPDAYFDTKYYLSRNPDIARAGVNPLLHYETNGWKEGRDPSAQFSTSKYLAAYGDVRAANVNPLLHFITSGQAEGRIAFTA